MLVNSYRKNRQSVVSLFGGWGGGGGGMGEIDKGDLRRIESTEMLGRGRGTERVEALNRLGGGEGSG